MSATSYDLIAVGTGSATNLIEPFLRRHPRARVAIIDKDKPGGICLTRGCIPTKLLTAAADVVRLVERAHEFGVRLRVEEIDFEAVMKRMHDHIDPSIEGIRKGLSSHPNIDYFREPAEFVAPYRLRLGKKEITSKLILLCAGSKPHLPPIAGLDKVPYHTTDTILDIEKLPKTLLIVGGGYIAAEFGHFFAAMGSKVTIVGRNKRFLPQEDHEVSALAEAELGKRMTLLTGMEAESIERAGTGVRLTARGPDRKPRTIGADLILVATGRSSNSDLLRPDRGGIKTDDAGWIRVNDHLETSQKGVWAFGDCIGRHQFKHSANYESLLVYRNAFLGENVSPDYHAVPHAVFTEPEIAGVGLTEEEARKKHHPRDLLVGKYLYENTAKGEALIVRDAFAKVIVHAKTRKVLGAHIIGPQASVLLQEVVNVMNVPNATFDPIVDGMHIHPALSEVVERAFGALRPLQKEHATHATHDHPAHDTGHHQIAD